MSDLERFKEVVDDVWKMVFGTERRPLKHTDLSKFEGMMMDKKPKRARTKGRYIGDDLTTNDVNEAWVGGKAPKKEKQKNVKK